MKILDLIRPAKTLVRTLAENQACRRATQTAGEDVVELSTKQPKLSKLSKFKAEFKKMLVGLDKATIASLEKLPINDFLSESQKLIAKSMGLSQDFLPPITITSSIDKKMGMCFDVANNSLFVNSQILTKSRKMLFSLMRHEMEHFKQNLLIIRTDGLGEKAVETYSKILTKTLGDNFVNTFKNMPESEIEKLKDAGNLTEIHLQAIKKLKNAAELGDEAVSKLSDELYNHDYPIMHASWQNIRNKAIELYGPVKANTEEASNAKEFFDGFLKTKGMTRGSEYYFSKHEQAAYTAQSFVFYEYLFKKLFG